MKRLEAHAGILITGISSAIMTLEASRHAAHTLRDEASPDTSCKAAMRYISDKIEEARTLLIQAEERLHDLQLGEGCASSKSLEPTRAPDVHPEAD